jgi:hypothetical protein
MRDLTILPRWDRREEVKRWTITQLDKERSSRPRSPLALKDGSGVVRIEPPIPRLATKLLALIAADAGNFKPLLAIYPKLRRPGRGKYRRHDRQWALQQAVADVKRIRELWKLNLGLWKRKDGLAEEIAAERWNLDLGELHNAL